jgi:NDP-sugar pyrophosphorylase family protein
MLTLIIDWGFFKDNLRVDIQVVILAGGKATRLGSLTKSRPKSLVMIGDKPFLEHQINMLHKAGARDFLLCLGYLGEQIRDYFGNGRRLNVKITYSIEDRPLGTAGALKNAEGLISDPFMTLYGDSYLSLNLEEIASRFTQSHKLGLMTVYRNSGLYDRSNTAIDNNGMVVKYDKQNTSGLEYIDYGLSVFHKQVLDWVPREEYYPLEEVFHKLIEMNELAAFEAKERFYEIGSPAGLEEFRKFVEVNKL